MRRTDLHTIGNWVFALVVIGVAASVALSFAMNIAADDLREHAAILAGVTPDRPRTAWGAVMSSWLTPNVDVTNRATTGDLADDVDHRADRIRELAAAGSLAGIIIMLATAKPEPAGITT